MYGMAGWIASQHNNNLRRSLLDGIFSDLGRSLLSSTPSFDFTDVNSLRTLIQQASNAMAASNSAALGSGYSDPTLVANAITAVTNLQTGLSSLSTPISLTQAAYVGQAGLSSALADLISGAITVSAFTSSTSIAAILSAAATTPVPGQLVPNSCTGTQVPVWESLCSSPDPFSCGSYAYTCANPPNWDITKWVFFWSCFSIESQSLQSASPYTESPACRFVACTNAFSCSFWRTVVWQHTTQQPVPWVPWVALSVALSRLPFASACSYRLDFAFQWDENAAGTDISGMNATLYQYTLPQVCSLSLS
jgi:hypothetical protein